MATGVLVVLIGRAAKASEYLSADTKRYRAKLRLGLTTDTEDITGEILSQSDSLPCLEDLQAVLPAFCGKIQQIPPMYSALKVNGKKLVDLARQGVVIERQAREIEIYELTATATDTSSDYILNVCCSGGTYIRTLCADIGNMLGCGGVMAELERTETSGFLIKQAHTISELEELSMEERLQLLIPTESLFHSHPALCLSPFYEKLCRSGCEIYLKKIKADLPIGARVRICNQQGVFFALGEVGEYPDGIAVKAIKTFSLN